MTLLEFIDRHATGLGILAFFALDLLLAAWCVDRR